MVKWKRYFSIHFSIGFAVATAPRSLTLLTRNENTLKITWEPPRVQNGMIQEYHVTATPLSSYSLNSVSSPMDWTFANTTLQGELLGLQPGTQYNVSVKAKTMEGYGTDVSAVYNTEIGGDFG